MHSPWVFQLTGQLIGFAQHGNCVLNGFFSLIVYVLWLMSAHCAYICVTCECMHASALLVQCNCLSRCVYTVQRSKCKHSRLISYAKIASEFHIYTDFESFCCCHGQCIFILYRFLPIYFPLEWFLVSHGFGKSVLHRNVCISIAR